MAKSLNKYICDCEKQRMLEIAAIIILGIFSQWIAWRIKVPAILPLILTGLLVGPLSTLWRDGGKWLNPIYNEATGNGLFPGQTLFYFVSLSIGIILFEGGLTLKRSEVRGVGPAIGKLVSVGSLITFIGAGLAAKFILGIPWTIAFLFSALIIVTGPTVIAPILRNIPLKKNIATILKWEGILIDPIGALVAVLVFEFIITIGGENNFTLHALTQFGKILVIGFLLGSIAAYGLYQMIKRKWIPHYLLNLFTLALVIGVFVGSEMLVHESGLLTVVVMGMVLGNMDFPNLKEILEFKEALSILLISILFILLSANINLVDLELLLEFKYLLLFLVVILIIRPLAVFASTTNSDLTLNDKLFISWVGPRGIVAAGIASLFGLKLVEDGIPYAEIITPLVFMIVLGTVLLNATTAALVAKALKVTLDKSNAILMVGAHKASRLLAKYLIDNGRQVILVDNNFTNIEIAKGLGIEAYQGNIYSEDLIDNIELNNVGYLMAMTSSYDVNKYVLERYGKIFGENGAHRLVSDDEMQDPDNNTEVGLFSHTDDFINFSEVARDYPKFHEVPINSKEQYKVLIEKLRSVHQSIPVFVKLPNGTFEIIGSYRETIEVEAGFELIYMGKKMEGIEHKEETVST